MKRITFFAILLCGILGLTSQYTHAETGTLCSYYDGSSDSGSFDEFYGGGTLEDVIEDGKPCFKFTNNQAKENIWDIAVFIDANLKEDYLYTVSFDIKGDPGVIRMGSPLHNSDPVNVTSEWSRITFQCKSGRNAEYTSFQLGRYVGTLYITNFVITYESPFDPSEPAQSMITNGDCSTDDVSCFFNRIGSSDPVPATIDKEAGAYRVDITDSHNGNTWDNQFFIKSRYQLPAGTPVSFKMKVKCTDTRYCSIQAHRENPGDYVHYSYLGGGFTTEANEWAEYSWTGEVQPETDRCAIAAFNLSENPEAATIWFKDIEWIAGKGMNAAYLGSSGYSMLSNLHPNMIKHLTVDGQKFLKAESNYITYDNKPANISASVMQGENVTGLTAGNTYRLTFDIAGTPKEGLTTSFGAYYSNPNDRIPGTPTFNITEQWQRVTVEVTPTNENISHFFINLDGYVGTLFLTNVFLYNADFNHDLPELPTIDPYTIPSEIQLFLPIAIGESLQLNAYIVPNNGNAPSVNWESNNPHAATVADGLVTGVSVGSAIISAISIGDNFFRTPINVMVTEPKPVTVPVSAIVIDPMVIDDAKVGDQIRLTANVMPENADDKSVTWSSSKEEVATVDESGLVTIVAPGTAVITATANDGNGAKGVCLISGMSGIEDIVYSSPDEPKDIYTIDGKLIMRRATRDDINRLSQGVYLIGNQKIAIR